VAENTYTGLQDQRTVLKWPFLNGTNVVERATIVVQEAHHSGGKDHNGSSRSMEHERQVL